MVKEEKNPQPNGTPKKTITIDVYPILVQMFWLTFWGTIFYLFPLTAWVYEEILGWFNVPLTWSGAMLIFLLTEIIVQPFFNKEK